MILISGFQKNKDQVQWSLFKKAGQNGCSKVRLREDVNHKSNGIKMDGKISNHRSWESPIIQNFQFWAIQDITIVAILPWSQNIEECGSCTSVLFEEIWLKNIVRGDMEVAPWTVNCIHCVHCLNCLNWLHCLQRKKAIMPLHMIWLYNFMDFMKSWCGGVDHTP